MRKANARKRATRSALRTLKKIEKFKKERAKTRGVPKYKQKK